MISKTSKACSSHRHILLNPLQLSHLAGCYNILPHLSLPYPTLPHPILFFVLPYPIISTSLYPSSSPLTSHYFLCPYFFHHRYLNFLKVGPKLLKWLPGKKASDLRTWLTVYSYWSEGTYAIEAHNTLVLTCYVSLKCVSIKVVLHASVYHPIFPSVSLIVSSSPSLFLLFQFYSVLRLVSLSYFYFLATTLASNL